MKTRKVLMIISALQIIILSIILVMGVIDTFTFEPNANDDIFGPYFEYWFRGYLMMLNFAGIFSATIVMISLRSYSLMPVTERNGINKVFLILSITANILFYLSMYSLFIIDRDWVSIVLLMWIIIQICSFVLFIVSLVK